MIYLYMIRYCRGSRWFYYTGQTTDPMRRWKEHMRGRGAKCLRGAYVEGMRVLLAVKTLQEALATEQRLKKLRHRQKEALYLAVEHSESI